MTTSEMLKREIVACAESIEEAVRNGKVDEYFEDALDVEITTDLYGEYRGARIALALGGPGVYLNTRSGFIEGYWGREYNECCIRSFAVNAVDDYFASQWDSCRY